MSQDTPPNSPALSRSKSRPVRVALTILGLSLTALSTPCVVASAHGILTQPGIDEGSAIVGSMFAVLLAIGVATTAWTVFGKRWSTEAADAVRLEHDVLRAAEVLQGKVTPTTLALETGVSLDKAGTLLASMVDRGVAETWVSEDGHIVYAFRAFVDPSDRLSAKDPLSKSVAAFDALEAAEAVTAGAEEAMSAGVVQEVSAPNTGRHN